MIADKLDYNPDKMEIVQLSNDAYHYLAFKEPCLDEDNMDEVKEFKEQFPYGFKFEPDIELVEDSDLVECKVIPICERSTPFTHYRLEGLWFKSEYYYNEDKTQVYYRTYDMYCGRFLDYGWNKVEINEYGKPEIRPKGCIFPLRGKSWLKY